MWYAKKNGQLVELVISYARKGGECKGTGPPEISINVVSKSCKSCTLTSITCRKILFYACIACSFVCQLLKRLRMLKVFSFLCMPHTKKNLRARRRSLGLSAWNAEWSIERAPLRNSCMQIFSNIIISFCLF